MTNTNTPVTLDMWAISMHEIYQSLRRAGFSRSQALALTGEAIHAQTLATSFKADD